MGQGQAIQVERGLDTDDRDTLIPPCPAGQPLIIEARADHVLVICGAFGGKGRSLSEAIRQLARRMGRRAR
jgi:hypothetical protein